ncbi:hypothetical protein SAMN04487818_10730 [Actinokineospora terrae]|uniref:Uncharacterized protein n=1 Tax=Actinokineospora terrae TaxID=155974 RepID=A0A1H9U7Y3_9PSEU|nr:hypothetical protein SAMN04487818_10730 [Actinokineospora terrae]
MTTTPLPPTPQRRHRAMKPNPHPHPPAAFSHQPVLSSCPAYLSRSIPDHLPRSACTTLTPGPQRWHRATKPNPHPHPPAAFSHQPVLSSCPAYLSRSIPDHLPRSTSTTPTPKPQRRCRAMKPNHHPHPPTAVSHQSASSPHCALLSRSIPDRPPGSTYTSPTPSPQRRDRAMESNHRLSPPAVVSFQSALNSRSKHLSRSIPDHPPGSRYTSPTLGPQRRYRAMESNHRSHRSAAISCQSALSSRPAHLLPSIPDHLPRTTHMTTALSPRLAQPHRLRPDQPRRPEPNAYFVFRRGQPAPRARAVPTRVRSACTADCGVSK